jgi:hypothetical protein
MSIGDFIDDPFGAVAKAGLDAAPDPGTLADAFMPGAASSENSGAVGGFDVPDGDNLAQYVDEHGIAGPGVADLAPGGETGPDVRSMMPFFSDDKSDPYQLGGVDQQPAEPYVDNSAPQIIHPDPMPDVPPEPSSAADDAAGYGAAGDVDGGAYDIF